MSIAVPPSVISSPESKIQLTTPALLSLSCSVDGFPLPIITWIVVLSNGSQIFYYNGNTTNGKQVIMYEGLDSSSISSIFSINATTASDSANYSCKATNRLGTSVSTASTVYIYCKFIYRRTIMSGQVLLLIMIYFYGIVKYSSF